MGSPYQFFINARRCGGVFFTRRKKNTKKNPPPPPASFIKNTENTFITTFCLINAFYEINYRLNSYNWSIHYRERAKKNNFFQSRHHSLSFTITLFNFKVNNYVEVSIQPYISTISIPNTQRDLFNFQLKLSCTINRKWWVQLKRVGGRLGIGPARRAPKIMREKSRKSFQKCKKKSNLGTGRDLIVIS